MQGQLGKERLEFKVYLLYNTGKYRREVLPMTIDFVIPWVQGNDPVWLEKMKQHSPLPIDQEESRFRDWDLLKFWFRAVETYAPWVNRIYFVSDGQIPHWLNTAHPKLCITDHRDYIPQEYLPTFSSHTIELNFHRLEGLSEQFVYFNDDMFLNAPVTPEDFFVNGKPRDCAVLDQFFPVGDRDAYIYAQCNVMAFLNNHFSKKAVLRDHSALWFSPVYGKFLLKNCYNTPSALFSNFKNFHIASSMLKSTYESLWSLEPELLDHTCRNKFRSPEDVNQYIFSYYNLCAGNFVPRSSSFGKCYSLGVNDSAIIRDIAEEKHRIICINDHPDITDVEAMQQKIYNVFLEKFPSKSQFEL